MQSAYRRLLPALLQKVQHDAGASAAAAVSSSWFSTASQQQTTSKILSSTDQLSRESQANAHPSQMSRSALQAAAALGVGLAAAGALRTDAHALAAEPHPAVQDVNVATPAADVYAIPQQTSGVPKQVVVFQYDVCPFCCKLKAVLDYYRIPYTCVEVGPLFKEELKWSKYKKVPVVMLDGEVIVDSSAIISRLAAEKDAEAQPAADRPKAKRGWFSRSANDSSNQAPSTSHTEEEERWRRWVDARLVRVLTINIYRNRAESFQTFDYITQQGNFSWAEREFGRVFGAATMWLVSGRLKKKYGILGDPREELYESARQWAEAVGERPFLGGDRPNLADLSTFGAIRSITETDTFMDLMHNSDISGWYERMMGVVGPTMRRNIPKAMPLR